MSRSAPRNNLKPSSSCHTIIIPIVSASCSAARRSAPALCFSRAAAFSASSSSSSPPPSSSLRSLSRPPQRRARARRGDTIPSSAASSSSSGGAAAMTAAVRVKATATFKVTVGGFFNDLRPSRAIDNVKDLIGRSLYLELVSSELDARPALLETQSFLCWSE